MLAELISHDPEINIYLSEEEICQLMQVEEYLGDAPKRARQLAAAIRKTVIV
jgi:hypothetical protein